MGEAETMGKPCGEARWKEARSVFLAIRYTPHVDLAFISVEHIMRDATGGWLVWREIEAYIGRAEFTFAYVSDPKGTETEANIPPEHGAFSRAHDRRTGKSQVFWEVRMNRFPARVLVFMPFTSGCMRY